MAGDVTLDDFLGFVEGGVLGSCQRVQLVELALGGCGSSSRLVWLGIARGWLAILSYSWKGATSLC